MYLTDVTHDFLCSTTEQARLHPWVWFVQPQLFKHSCPLAVTKLPHKGSVHLVNFSQMDMLIGSIHPHTHTRTHFHPDMTVTSVLLWHLTKDDDATCCIDGNKTAADKSTTLTEQGICETEIASCYIQLHSCNVMTLNIQVSCWLYPKLSSLFVDLIL